MPALPVLAALTPVAAVTTVHQYQQWLDERDSRVITTAPIGAQLVLRGRLERDPEAVGRDRVAFGAPPPPRGPSLEALT